jgi:imidazolonepropionase-like amidohydrolase
VESDLKQLHKRLTLRVFTCIAGALSLQSCTSVPQLGDGHKRTLIRNVTVIPMYRPGSIPHQDVMISSGRIVVVARTGSVRTTAQDEVIEGAGKFLMPGLWDMHSHSLTGGAAPARQALSLYLAHGVVGVRDIGSTLEDLASAKQEMPTGTELPQLVASGPVLDGPKQPWQQKVALALNTVDEARAGAEKVADAGADFLKIYNNLSPQQFAAVTEVAKRRGLSFAGHVPFKVSLEQVSAAGQKSIEHAGFQLIKDCTPDGQRATPSILGAWIKDGYPGRFEETSRWWAKRDQAACTALYRRMAQRQTWVTPTLTNEVQGGRWTTPDDLSLLSGDRLRACESNLKSMNLKPAARDAADEAVFNLVRDLHKAGVPLLAGTDTPNSCMAYGSSLHKELEMLRHSGLSPWEVLKTATINPARFLERTDEGVVRTGAVANVLLLDADPLADVSNTRRISGVMMGGRWRGGAELAAIRATGRGEATKLYENAMVWTGSRFERRTLAVRGGEFVDPASASGRERVDLSGGFVVPAYGNAHYHLTSPNAASSWLSLAAGVFYIWNPNTVMLNQRALDFFKRKDTFDVLISQGSITEPGGHPERGYVEVLSKFVYKGMTLKGFLGNAFHYGRTAAEIDEALDLLTEQKADFVKAMLLHSEDYEERRNDARFYGRKGLNPANFRYLVQAAKKRGHFTYAHIETVSDLQVAATSGAAVAGHLPAYGPVDSVADLSSLRLTREVAERIARSGIMLVPTYNYGQSQYEAQEKAGTLNERVKAQTYSVQAHNLRLLQAAGAILLSGTDSEAGIFEEAEHLVKIGGLTNAEALRMVLETGKHLFPKRRIGCFEAACEADFLVLSADPSRDIGNLRDIVGRVKAGQELQAPLEKHGH